MGTHLARVYIQRKILEFSEITCDTIWDVRKLVGETGLLHYDLRNYLKL